MVELVILFFDETSGAARALGELRRRGDEGRRWLEDVAVVEHHRSGRVATHVPHASVTEGTAAGVVTGALVGLLFPPAAIGALAVLAGAGGAGFAKLHKAELVPREVLDDVLAGLEAGTSALLLAGEPVDVATLEAEARTLECVRVRREPLPEPIVAGLSLGLA